MTEEELAALAANVGKSLKWAGFLLAAMLAILLIDLQLKRSIARTAIVAAGRHDSIVRLADSIVADLTRSGNGRSVVATGDSASRGTGSDGVDGDAPVATPASDPGGEAASVPAAAPARTGKRTPGNGRRTSRPEAGS